MAGGEDLLFADCGAVALVVLPCQALVEEAVMLSYIYSLSAPRTFLVCAEH